MTAKEVRAEMEQETGPLSSLHGLGLVRKGVRGRGRPGPGEVVKNQ